jgi:hypothetical protein
MGRGFGGASALRLRRLARSRLSRFVACSGAPFHRLPPIWLGTRHRSWSREHRPWDRPNGHHLNSAMRMRASRGPARLQPAQPWGGSTRRRMHPAAFLGRFSPLLEAEYLSDVAAGLRALATWVIFDDTAPHCPCRVRQCVFRQPLCGFGQLRAAYGQGHIEHDWRGVLAREGSLRRRPRFVCKEGAALDRAYGRPVQAAWLFSAAQNGGRYLRPHRPQGPRHSISSDCRGRSRVGPSNASVYRPPPGNWQSRWSTRDYLLRGRDRLPMTLCFMAIFAAAVEERVNARAGAVLLWPLLVIGVFSLLLWRWPNDLRLYTWVQFPPPRVTTAVHVVFAEIQRYILLGHRRSALHAFQIAGILRRCNLFGEIDS